VLIGISLLTFGVFTLLPGSAAQQLLGADATANSIFRLEAELNIDRPAWKQYLDWLHGAATGDLGRSLASRQRVSHLLAARLPVTIELVLCALVLALGAAVPMALLAAHTPGGVVDRVGAAISMGALSIPNYVVALLLVFVFSVHLKLFPSIGFVDPGSDLLGNMRSVTLPALSLATPLFGLYSRFLRGDLIEQMRDKAYIVTAAAKGIGRWRILLCHALRNSVFGLLTLVGLHVGTLLGGAVIIEQIFALPGVGKLLLQAINTRDVPVVQAVVLLLATVTVLANLAVDFLYLMLDPRVRYGR
jgi:peptide/nickel transport system permease protein